MSEKGDMIQNNPYLKSLEVIIKINKELEEEFNFANKEINNDIDRSMISSIFSLLDFQITLINQLSELNSQISEKTEINQKIMEKLTNFSKELLYQKIKQILMFNHNNIIYKNYIDNSSSLKINNDKIHKKKKKIINLNSKNILENNENSLYNKSKIINRTLDLDEKKQYTIRNYLDCPEMDKKISLKTSINNNKRINKNRTFKANSLKKRNFKAINIKKQNNTIFHNYNSLRLSEKK